MRLSDISPDETLWSLQRLSYAVEAELIGDDRIPPLHESLDDLLSEPLTWIGAFDEEERLIGAIAWSIDDDGLLDIERLVVAPSAFRRGVGRTLVTEALTRAGARGALVSTGRDNKPARSLYERLGFAWVEDVEVIPGLWITRYAR
ncbi:GNAT family N-acetyltransferase [Nonomuraea soli]|uniref:Ribosomal protein S18 acetylase RimI-like enzyme n=1 Tax=Nonomuraea soli TaxID=1032476 RepID=A0A7W0CN78_9ACTN|nr:GNAT family N-acetyltransferase [Nonomuraea soli]MBA2894198.1 ribosomal protein S18 acetylase RimI-like enzyme [Nonomuraea soli]